MSALHPWGLEAVCSVVHSKILRSFLFSATTFSENFTRIYSPEHRAQYLVAVVHCETTVHCVVTLEHFTIDLCGGEHHNMTRDRNLVMLELYTWQLVTFN